MCKKVDGLLNTLETEIDNTDVDINGVCKELNKLKLNDRDMLRVSKLMIRKKKWYLLILLIIGVLLYYIVLSASIAFVVASLYILLLTFIPSYISMSLTLTVLLALVSSVHCRSL